MCVTAYAKTRYGVLSASHTNERKGTSVVSGFGTTGTAPRHILASVTGFIVCIWTEQNASAVYTSAFFKKYKTAADSSCSDRGILGGDQADPVCVAACGFARVKHGTMPAPIKRKKAIDSCSAGPEEVGIDASVSKKQRRPSKNESAKDNNGGGTSGKVQVEKKVKHDGKGKSAAAAAAAVGSGGGSSAVSDEVGIIPKRNKKGQLVFTDYPGVQYERRRDIYSYEVS